MFKFLFISLILPSFLFSEFKDQIEQKLDFCIHLKQYVENFDPEEREYIAFLNGKEEAYKDCLEIIIHK